MIVGWPLWQINIRLLKGTDTVASYANVYFNSIGQLLGPQESQLFSSDSDISMQNLSDIIAPEIQLSNLSEFWTYFGRSFVLLYWLLLADLGQISAVSLPSPPYLTSVDPSAGNIFVNATLYQDNLAYFNESPFLNLNELSVAKLLPLPKFTPLQPVDTVFLQSYSCEQRRLKTGISLLISVVVADYALIVGGYSLVMFIAGVIQKRRRDGD